MDAVTNNKPVIKFLSTCGNQNLQYLLVPARLEQALADLLFWVSVSCSASSNWLEDLVLTNQVLCEWIQHVYESGGKISLARHGILSIQTARRELKGKLGRAWDALKGWQMRTPLKSRVPIPKLLMRAFFIFWPWWRQKTRMYFRQSLSH